MKSLLSALEKGRLIQLPELSKEKALELLARLIEAIPDIGTKTDIMKSVLEREAEANTAIGRGIACPHCRSTVEGEMLCAVGWSPTGIDYGAPDGHKVHLVFMYYVPDSQRNAYLKEISALAKATAADGSIESVSSMPDLRSARDKLLDWVALAISETLPESKARMIKLVTKQAIAGAPSAIEPGSHFFPFRLVAWSGGALVLAADASFVEDLDRESDLGARIAGVRELDVPGYRIAVLSESVFAAGRTEYEGVAVRVGPIVAPALGG